jgi:hypothetical protein
MDPDGYRTHALKMHIVMSEDELTTGPVDADLFGSSTDTESGLEPLFRPAGLPPSDATGCHKDIAKLYRGHTDRPSSPASTDAGDKTTEVPPFVAGSSASTESGRPSTADRVADAALDRLTLRPAQGANPYLLQFPADDRAANDAADDARNTQGTMTGNVFR